MSANTALFGADESPELLGARVKLNRLRAEYAKLKGASDYAYAGLFGIALNPNYYRRQALAAELHAVEYQVEALERVSDYSRIEARVLTTVSGIKVPAWGTVGSATTGRGLWGTKTGPEVLADINHYLTVVMLQDELAAEKEKNAMWERGQAVIAAQRDEARAAASALQAEVDARKARTHKMSVQLEDWQRDHRAVRRDRDDARSELQRAYSDNASLKYRLEEAEAKLQRQWWNVWGRS